MIVDADPGVHTATTSALAGLDVLERQIDFVHAYSAPQARLLLEREPEIAVVLLDVVLEQADAGLLLAHHIRETLGRADLRIILCTGQPGDAPPTAAIRDYDINDYHPKSELTGTRLYTAVAAAIRSYRQLRGLDVGRRGLEYIVRASAELMGLHGLPAFGRGVLEQAAGLIGQEPDGMLCALDPQPDDDARLFVAAATGAGQQLAQGVLSAAGGALVPSAIARALRERCNCYEAQYLTLYFPGKAGRDFAAYLALARPIGEIKRGLLEVFCRQVALAMDNLKLMINLNNAAFHDPLTGLPNRTRLVELLDAALAGPQRDGAIVALVDIDHFVETSDALGHDFGDLLLVAVARRLVSQLGPHLTVARTGSDTFCVLGDGQAVDPAALHPLFDAPFPIDGQEVQLSATLGLVRLREHDGSGADALKDADIALRRAKAQQGAGHYYFSRSMGVEIRERVRMMHALRRGFARGELFLAYQPQVELANHRPFGAEALLRWRTGDARLVSPDRFIPIAEYSGLIVELGEWVLRQACAELVRLRQAGYRDFTMSVNVSQVQLRHPHFLDMLRRALADSGAPPECIELEITESMAMEEPAVLAEMLAQVKRAGVSIAIDDFGTGFSSLSHLQRLQVDRLKIDRAFVSEITGSARGSSIANMVVQLGRNLGLSVIAEGVEDERQARILHALGCPLAQGFLFSRPLSPQALLAWLDSDKLTRVA
jgi:diguanylate cyclase (GGDEF)-like protein